MTIPIVSFLLLVTLGICPDTSLKYSVIDHGYISKDILFQVKKALHSVA